MNYRIYASSFESAWNIADTCEFKKFAIVRESKKKYQIVTSKNFLPEYSNVLYSQNFS